MSFRLYRGRCFFWVRFFCTNGKYWCHESMHFSSVRFSLPLSVVEETFDLCSGWFFSLLF